MAAGDFVKRRNNANTDTIADGGTSLLLLWDTAVDNEGAGITYSSGIFTLGETGHFLVLFSDHQNDPSTANNRINSKVTITLAGSELVNGYCSSYFRRGSSNTPDYVMQGMAIVNVTTTTGNGDELELRSERFDPQTGGPTARVGNTFGGVTIIKLDDDWGYGRYKSSSVFTTSSTDNAATEATLGTTTEQDSPFTRSTNTIDIATTNPVLIIYSLKSEDATTNNNRSEYQGRLNINAGTILAGGWTQFYGPRGTNERFVGMSGMMLYYPTSGDDLILEVITRENGGEDFEATLDLVELPAGTESCIVEATTGNFHPGSGTAFIWDTEKQKDDDAFTHTAGQSNIDVDNAGDYLVMSSQAVTSDAGFSVGRRLPTAQFRVNSVNDTGAGHTPYHRSSGTADHGVCATATLLTSVSVNHSLEVWNDDALSSSTATITCESGAFAAIRLSSLFAAPAVDLLPGFLHKANLQAIKRVGNF